MDVTAAQRFWRATADRAGLGACRAETERRLRRPGADATPAERPDQYLTWENVSLVVG